MVSSYFWKSSPLTSARSVGQGSQNARLFWTGCCPSMFTDAPSRYDPTRSSQPGGIFGGANNTFQQQQQPLARAPRARVMDGFLDRVAQAEGRDQLRNAMPQHAESIDEGINLSNWTKRSKSLAALMEKNDRATAEAIARSKGQAPPHSQANLRQSQQVQKMQQQQSRHLQSSMQRDAAEDVRQAQMQRQQQIQAEQQMQRQQQMQAQQQMRAQQQHRQQMQQMSQQRQQQQQVPQAAAGGFRRTRTEIGGDINHSSTFVHAPPGGASSFSLGWDNGPAQQQQMTRGAQPLRNNGGRGPSPRRKASPRAAGSAPRQRSHGGQSFIFG